MMLTGDFLTADGNPADGVDLDILRDVPHIEAGFLMDLKPDPNDSSYWDRLYSLEILPHHIADADGLVVCRPWVKAKAFARGADRLVAIGRAGAGFDKIDLAACTANDVAVFYSPNTFIHSTASAALLLILALAKRLFDQERVARSGHWEQQGSVKGNDLVGMTLGIVGLGNTGKELARLVSPFKMRVIAYSPHADPEEARLLGVKLVPHLHELLRQSDFVSLHCRLEEHTRGMIGEREFRLMKRKAYFINVSRGELVQQSALTRCLRDRWIAGAGLDVFEREPLSATDPLIQLDNVILTPHYLAATHEGTRATVISTVQGMLQVAQGCVPENVINPEVLDRPGFRAKLGRFARTGPKDGLRDVSAPPTAKKGLRRRNSGMESS